ncbi:MAG: hypothetical protein ACK45H_14130 [Bacteroidota bacterium]
MLNKKGALMSGLFEFLLICSGLLHEETSIIRNTEQTMRFIGG